MGLRELGVNCLFFFSGFVCLSLCFCLVFLCVVFLFFVAGSMAVS